MKTKAPLILAGFLACAVPFGALAQNCLSIKSVPVLHINIDAVRGTWLSWVNEERAKLGLQPYTLNEHLNATASNWSTFSVARGTIDHRRKAGAPYYDFNGIGKWFASKGLSFEKSGGKTLVENIGWGVYDCDKADCTSELISSIRSTFDFFMSEKGKASDAHYRSLMSPQYTTIGVGVAESGRQGRYYLTVHYATEIAEDTAPLCTAAR